MKIIESFPFMLTVLFLYVSGYIDGYGSFTVKYQALFSLGTHIAILGVGIVIGRIIFKK